MIVWPKLRAASLLRLTDVNSEIAPFEDAMESYLVTDFRRQLFLFLICLAVNFPRSLSP